MTILNLKTNIFFLGFKRRFLGIGKNVPKRTIYCSLITMNVATLIHLRPS